MTLSWLCLLFLWDPNPVKRKKWDLLRPNWCVPEPPHSRAVLENLQKELNQHWVSVDGLYEPLQCKTWCCHISLCWIQSGAVIWDWSQLLPYVCWETEVDSFYLDQNNHEKSLQEHTEKPDQKSTLKPSLTCPHLVGVREEPQVRLMMIIHGSSQILASMRCRALPLSTGCVSL